MPARPLVRQCVPGDYDDAKGDAVARNMACTARRLAKLARVHRPAAAFSSDRFSNPTTPSSVPSTPTSRAQLQVWWHAYFSRSASCLALMFPSFRLCSMAARHSLSPIGRARASSCRAHNVKVDAFGYPVDSTCVRRDNSFPATAFLRLRIGPQALLAAPPLAA